MSILWVELIIVFTNIENDSLIVHDPNVNVLKLDHITSQLLGDWIFVFYLQQANERKKMNIALYKTLLQKN